MGDRSELGVHAVCCLLHNLIPGGSGWQWINLLGRHVEHGGRATIFAPPGALAEPARAAGIEVVRTSWDVDVDPDKRPNLWASIGRHDAAIVHWDHLVMDAFGPALQACGRVALVLHQAPHGLEPWLGSEAVAKAQVVLEEALAEKNAVVLVRGEAHRRRVAAAFDLPPSELRILPASIPLSRVPFHPVEEEPMEVLALTRLSPEKAAIVRLAVELVRARLAAGHPCHLRIAGSGPWHSETVELCERRLRAGTWSLEDAPEDPITCLASSPLVVAQGLTTLEATALGRRVVVARSGGEEGPAGTVLLSNRYEEAAQDPFGEPPLTTDCERLWIEILAVGVDDLRSLRHLVETRNTLEVASRALGEALAATHEPPSPLRRLFKHLRL